MHRHPSVSVRLLLTCVVAGRSFLGLVGLLLLVGCGCGSLLADLRRRLRRWLAGSSRARRRSSLLLLVCLLPLGLDGGVELRRHPLFGEGKSSSSGRQRQSASEGQPSRRRGEGETTHRQHQTPAADSRAAQRLTRAGLATQAAAEADCDAPSQKERTTGSGMNEHSRKKPTNIVYVDVIFAFALNPLQNS